MRRQPPPAGTLGSDNAVGLSGHGLSVLISRCLKRLHRVSRLTEKQRSSKRIPRQIKWSSKADASIMNTSSSRPLQTPKPCSPPACVNQDRSNCTIWPEVGRCCTWR